MIFKNAKFYALTQSLDLSNIEAACAEYAFRPCGNSDLATMGWANEFGRQLVTQVSGLFTLALKKEEKLLPARVVNREVDEAVAAIELETGAPVGKKAKSDIKQEVVFRMLPLAFTDHSYTWGTVIPSKNLVIVYATSDGAAETFLAMLRKTIGSLPVVPLARRSISMELTHWMSEKSPSLIDVLDEAELKSTDELGSVIRCKNQPLNTDEVQAHINTGKLIQKLAIQYDDSFSAVFCEDGSLKRIRFSDRILEETDDIPKDQVAARFEAETILICNLLCQFAEFVASELNLIEDEAA